MSDLPSDRVTRAEHESLRKDFHEGMNQMSQSITDLGAAVRDGFRNTREEFQRENKSSNERFEKNIEDLYGRFYSSNEKMHNATKTPWGVIISLLGLIFVVMAALFGSVKSETTRVELQSQRLDREQSVAMQRDIMLVNATVDRFQKSDHEALTFLAESVRLHHLQDAEANARTDERVKMLWELRNEKSKCE